ncbi:membrane protein [Microbacterium phage Pumpernickel]|uniref:Membrane protein n=1 Tax=Microbacterium phage Pumpernickel TaxID=2885983 RepID=A0AAE8Y7N9_9CAUD|nr:membrane protein [Microbacterium phage Pumpernickel]UDL16030.1 membrane protein [Microbacterium phage Pumpernickel]
MIVIIAWVFGLIAVAFVLGIITIVLLALFWVIGAHLFRGMLHSSEYPESENESAAVVELAPGAEVRIEVGNDDK